ncbi:MAG: ABC transporter ATP-binding protein [Deltaproteobacteria bacterium]|nr:ABC transporter ATP-binding protein [Deltaproteobacteria bacterium]
MIRLRNVVKTYRQGRAAVPALQGVSLDVAEGAFVSVMGASGSGKSTMLHLIGGLDVPDSGSISVGGQQLGRLSDDELTLFRRRKIGFVFQFFNLLPTLTAEENVALPLLLDGKSLHEARPRVESLLERVGLGARRCHKPDELSGGEMQRVAIARALVVDPLLVLADEPTGNLDSKTGEEILHLMKETAEQARQTVVMVTHDARAAAYGERIVTLKDGRVVGDLCGEEGERP